MGEQYGKNMISKGVMGEKYVVVSVSAMGEQYVEQTSGNVDLKRMNDRQGCVDCMISKIVIGDQYVVDSEIAMGEQRQGIWRQRGLK